MCIRKRLWRQKGSGSMLILGLMAVLLLFLFGCFLFHIRMMNHFRDVVDDGLTLALLGSASINVEEYGRTKQAVIHDTAWEEDVYHSPNNGNTEDSYLADSYDTFQQCLKTNLKLDSDGISLLTMPEGAINIDEYRVYNVYKYYAENTKVEEIQIYEFIYDGSLWKVNKYQPGEKVYLIGNGRNGIGKVLIEDTAVYAKISFDLKVFPYLQGFLTERADEQENVTVSIERCVSVPLIE